MSDHMKFYQVTYAINHRHHHHEEGSEITRKTLYYTNKKAADATVEILEDAVRVLAIPPDCFRIQTTVLFEIAQNAWHIKAMKND